MSGHNTQVWSYSWKKMTKFMACFFKIYHQNTYSIICTKEFTTSKTFSCPIDDVTRSRKVHVCHNKTRMLLYVALRAYHWKKNTRVILMKYHDLNKSIIEPVTFFSSFYNKTSTCCKYLFITSSSTAGLVDINIQSAMCLFPDVPVN